MSLCLPLKKKKKKKKELAQCLVCLIKRRRKKQSFSRIVFVLGTSIAARKETYTDVYSGIMIWLCGGSLACGKTNLFLKSFKSNQLKFRTNTSPELAHNSQWWKGDITCFCTGYFGLHPRSPTVILTCLKNGTDGEITPGFNLTELHM